LKNNDNDIIIIKKKINNNNNNINLGTLVNSDSYAVRDLNYDGHPKHERIALVLRIAPCFIRKKQQQQKTK